MLKRLFLAIKSFPGSFFNSSLDAATVRLLGLVVILALFTSWMANHYESVLLNMTYYRWMQENIYVILVTEVFHVPEGIIKFIAIFTSWSTFRYCWAGIVPVVLALLVGARYTQDIYDLEKFFKSMKYILGCLFALSYPSLEIENGKRNVQPDEQNLIDVIGGPGYVTIRPGNLVLFEKLRGPSNIRSAGRHFITSGETIKEIVSLEDQHGEIDLARDVTKDGIEVNVRKIRYRYRLRTGRHIGDLAERSAADPFPYSVEAMRDMAYNRNVIQINPDTKKLQDWSLAVKLAVDAGITGYIQRNTIDHLTAPSTQEKDPRVEIANALDAKSIRQRLRLIGAELLWVDIGQFEIPEDTVDEQRTNTWAAKWVGKSSVIRAYGEAQELMYKELGRAEAQAEMLMSIVSALEEAKVSGDSEENLSKLVLMRTARIIEAMAERDRLQLSDGNQVD